MKGRRNGSEPEPFRTSCIMPTTCQPPSELGLNEKETERLRLVDSVHHADLE